MSPHDLLDALDGLGRPKILVLGDLMLDRYTWGDAARVSQEAPVLVLRADRREGRPGGAANVANMLAGLDAEVTCAGVVGCDATGQELEQLLAAAGVDCRSVLPDAHRPTSVKERFMGRAASRHPSQILRVDRECHDPIDAQLENRLIERIEALLPWHDALLVSDYGKGVCTTRVLRAVIEAANLVGIPVIVDPSLACPLESYRGATVIKPNRGETEKATGLTIATPSDALVAGRQLCRKLAARMALITLDRDGMMLVERSGHGEHFPTQARGVYDITGAGDMVMAMVGLCLADSASAEVAVRLGNIAAGLEVERAGVATIQREEIRGAILATMGGSSSKIITRPQAARLAREHRQRGEKIVFTNGCFDLLHVGHVTYLDDAAKLGDVLIVAVNSDHSVRRLKGPNRPVIGQADRAAMLAALGSVRYVVEFDDDTPCRLLEAIRPDVLVKGGTYEPHEVVGHEIVESYGGKVCVAGLVEGISTTSILASLPRGGPAALADQKLRVVTPPSDPKHPHPDWRRAG